MTEFKPSPEPVVAKGLRNEPRTDPLPLRRDDLAAAVAGYRRDSRAPRAWVAVAVGFGGLVVASILIGLGDRLGWPGVFEPIFFVGGWVVLLTSFGVLWRRERRLRARYQVHCPSCGEPLLDSTSSRPGVSRAELAIATGNCPHCGAHILPS